MLVVAAGIRVASLPLAGRTLGLSGAAVRIGEGLVGVLDDVRVWGRALSAREVAARAK